ncbi:MAG: hypothetical protein D8M58_20445 [Calditrichaeota bacterium]|nr:MAG: hypothetical protein DWQ03_14430 [Calditrichota bacterium]MBL1207781.1 hypothetical protein [Calditrichota bacterium]NOG47614.1 hypothetical protein [Calditrichota bacterium]
MRALGTYLFTGMIIILSSCSTETGVEPEEKKVNPVKSTYSSISTQIFDQRCSCHHSGQTPGLQSSTAYTNIIGVSNFANTMNYIEPGKPDSSYLFQKIIESGNISGSRMPRDGATTGHLSQVELDSIRTWIENGALNN